MIEKESSVQQSVISVFHLGNVLIEHSDNAIPLDDVEKLVFIYFEEHRRMRTSAVNFLFCSPTTLGSQRDHLI